MTENEKCSDPHCFLPLGHKKLHHYKCASKNCPGYTWRASEDPHPEDTCTGDQGVLAGTLEPGFFRR